MFQREEQMVQGARGLPAHTQQWSREEALKEREKIYSCVAAESLACPRVNRSRCGD
jgi:hypothetical protein